MRNVEELLASVPPKFLLDNYWKVLDTIRWQGLTGFEDREYFTISDLSEKILKEIRESENPFYARICSRSVDVIEEVVNQLVRVGLLIKEGDTLKKTDQFSDFYNMLKRIKNSLKNLVAWAIWYLYSHKKISFSTEELISLLSYEDENYVHEIPNLIKWEADHWIELLEKCNEHWKLLKEPPLPSSSTPILLTDIQTRLSLAISHLSKFKDKFRTKEIIEKLREMEIKTAERALKRLGLKYENEKWWIDQKLIERIKDLLTSEVREWPFLGVFVFKDPYVKLSSKTMYVDVPNATIWYFLILLKDICNRFSGDVEKIYEEARKLAASFNKSFEKLGKWLLFIVKKQPTHASKPIGIQIKIDWKNFYSFLESFANKEIPLWEKYSYLLDCRAPSLKLVLRGKLETVQNRVRKICEEEIRGICQNLETLISEINRAKDYLFKITFYRRTIPVEPSTLEYLPEMISTLRSFIFLVENGNIPTCYREMRKVLENLSWVIFDDLLFYRTVLVRKTKNSGELAAYRLVSKEWYEWAVQDKEKLMIKNLGELKKRLKKLTNMIYAYGEDKGYGWSKERIAKTLFKKISYPLFLLLTGIDVRVPKELEEKIPHYEKEQLRTFAIEDLKNILKNLGRTRLSKSDKRLIDNLLNTLLGDASEIIPPYPTNEFVLAFVSKTFSINLEKLYREYSHFVHSYFTSWTIFPFSSVLEFKIFRYELGVFSKILSQLMNSYLLQVFQSRIDDQRFFFT